MKVAEREKRPRQKEYGPGANEKLTWIHPQLAATGSPASSMHLVARLSLQLIFLVAKALSHE
jgi:hypothetical protein